MAPGLHPWNWRERLAGGREGPAPTRLLWVESRLSSQWRLCMTRAEHLPLLSRNVSHFLFQSWVSPFRGLTISRTPSALLASSHLPLPLLAPSFPAVCPLTKHPGLVFWPPPPPPLYSPEGRCMLEQMMERPRECERQVGTVFQTSVLVTASTVLFAA